MRRGVPEPTDDAARAHETSLSPDDRRRDGVFYTPGDVASGLVEAALGDRAWPSGRWPTVCDPTCGGGAFLVAAADHLFARGVPAEVIVTHGLWGADLDPTAVEVARRAVADWATAKGVSAEPAHLVVADTLLGAGAGGAWPDRPAAGFDLVVGNPPFQNQLMAGTARDRDRAAAVRAELGAAVAPYADSAALFLVVASGLAAPGGRVALILPESVLAARDAGPARAVVRDRADIVGLWWAGEPVFEAGVRVCAPVLQVFGGESDSDTDAEPTGPSALPVQRWWGRRFEPARAANLPEGPPDAPWSPLLATLRGTPVVAIPSGPETPRLESLASATAGFRDQYYGIVPFVTEADPTAAVDPAGSLDRVVALVTAGLIDPFHCRWGTALTRFAGRAWRAPVVDVVRMRTAHGGLGAWADARLVPKVMVATQTRVVEPVVDTAGSWWPSVPTIAVVPHSGDPADLWAVAAVLAAPPVTAWALEHFGGSALSSDAVKLSAGQVRSVPLPEGRDAWAVGTAAARAAQAAADRGDVDAWLEALDELGRSMTAAYGADEEVFHWWRARRPAWR